MFADALKVKWIRITAYTVSQTMLRNAKKCEIILIEVTYVRWICLDYILKALEPVHEISNNVVCATSEASDQPAHMCSLIRAFASRLSIPWLLSYWLNIILSF